MEVFRTFDTQRLTRADVALVPNRLRRRWLPWLLCLAAIAGSAFMALHGQMPVGFASITLRQQNAALHADLDHARVDLQMERATRAELQRQIQSLGDEVARLNQQLEFVNSRSGK
jgi:hypothetical protein